MLIIINTLSKNNDTLTSIAKNNMPSYGIKHAIEMIKETNKIDR